MAVKAFGIATCLVVVGVVTVTWSEGPAWTYVTIPSYSDLTSHLITAGKGVWQKYGSCEGYYDTCYSET